MKIIGIGEVAWDCFPEGRRFGGVPINFCSFTKELGAESHPATAIGEDGLGDETFAVLKETGPDSGYISCNILSIGKVPVSLSRAGIPRYDTAENVAWDAIECSPATMKLVSDADTVCWGPLTQQSEEPRAAILRFIDVMSGASLKAFDINIRQHFYSTDLTVESLQKANVLKLNEDGLPLSISLLSLSTDSVEATTELITRFSLKYVIFTQGMVRSGIYDTSRGIPSVDALKVEVTDIIGAGDPFTTIFVMSILRGTSVAESHHKTVDISAHTCT